MLLPRERTAKASSDEERRFFREILAELAEADMSVEWPNTWSGQPLERFSQDSGRPFNLALLQVLVGRDSAGFQQPVWQNWNT